MNSRGNILKDYYENKLLVLFKELGVLSENREVENKEKIENNTIINTETHIENIGFNENCEREDSIGDIGINGDDDENGEIIKRTTTPIKTSKNTIPKKKITIKALFPEQEILSLTYSNEKRRKILDVFNIVLKHVNISVNTPFYEYHDYRNM